MTQLILFINTMNEKCLCIVNQYCDTEQFISTNTTAIFND